MCDSAKLHVPSLNRILHHQCLPCREPQASHYPIRVTLSDATRILPPESEQHANPDRGVFGPIAGQSTLSSHNYCFREFSSVSEACCFQILWCQCSTTNAVWRTWVSFTVICWTTPGCCWRVNGWDAAWHWGGTDVSLLVMLHVIVTFSLVSVLIKTRQYYCGLFATIICVHYKISILNLACLDVGFTQPTFRLIWRKVCFGTLASLTLAVSGLMFTCVIWQV